VKLFEQEMVDLEEPFPGCLLASYTYQSELFDESILELIRDSMLTWRKKVLNKLKAIKDKYPPKEEVDLESLADMLLVIFEGAFVLTQSLQDSKIIASQLSHYHTYLSLLFGANQ
jgi:TetR/AcrR family transcriptional repressor of nem operon